MAESAACSAAFAYAAATAAAAGFGARHWLTWRKRVHSFLSFPYVCPEPVLVNRSFLYKWLKKYRFSHHTLVVDATRTVAGRVGLINLDVAELPDTAQ